MSQRYELSDYHIAHEFRAKVQCLFTIRAAHAYKYLGPTCSILGVLVLVARVGVYRVGRRLSRMIR